MTPSPTEDRHLVVMFLDRLDGIVLVEMPRRTTITFKDSKASRFEIIAEFEEGEWNRLRQDWESFGLDRDAKSKGAYHCVVHERGDDKLNPPEEREMLLNLAEVKVIV